MMPGEPPAPILHRNSGGAEEELDAGSDQEGK